MKVVALLSFLISFLFMSPSFAADRIRIGYSGLSPATAMLWVTQEGKLFERNGLNPEILFLRNNLGQSAMIAGESTCAAIRRACWRRRECKAPIC